MIKIISHKNKMTDTSHKHLKAGMRLRSRASAWKNRSEVSCVPWRCPSFFPLKASQPFNLKIELTFSFLFLLLQYMFISLINTYRMSVMDALFIATLGVTPIVKSEKRTCDLDLEHYGNKLWESIKHESYGQLSNQTLTGDDWEDVAEWVIVIPFFPCKVIFYLLSKERPHFLQNKNQHI